MKSLVKTSSRSGNDNGYEGLASREDLRRGRPSKLNSEDIERLKDLLKVGA